MRTSDERYKIATGDVSLGRDVEHMADEFEEALSSVISGRRREERERERDRRREEQAAADLHCRVVLLADELGDRYADVADDAIMDVRKRYEGYLTKVQAPSLVTRACFFIAPMAAMASLLAATRSALYLVLWLVAWATVVAIVALGTHIRSRRVERCFLILDAIDRVLALRREAPGAGEVTPDGQGDR